MSLGPYQAAKLHRCYRKSNSKDIRCATCDNHSSHRYHGKFYHKCRLIGSSSSSATDIRLSYVCRSYVRNGVRLQPPEPVTGNFFEERA